MPVKDLVGIAIVHFEDSESTQRCLESIRRDTSNVERRIVVVDNSGNFPETLLANGERRLASPDNPGFGEGANRGLRHLLQVAEPNRLLVLNHDTEIAPGFLAGVCRALAIDGAAAAAGPIYSFPPENALWYAGGSINYLTGTVRQSTSPRDAARAREVDFLPGTALALSTKAFKEIGGFDRRFFLYNEDLDLCRRLAAGNRRLFFEPSMRSHHLLGAATGSKDHSPLYLENLTAGRFLPFRSRIYRAYLAGVHTPYVMFRCAALALRFRRKAGPRIAALLRGHRRALQSTWAGKPPRDDRPSRPPS